ncbi:NAD(P)H-dependent flavin oxidoreductase [Coralliovum pocilloporae]|uniref:NAD(P)H-dependent flavin oxidoreductase n=1 Tax=Coralliovum pocilloporae TaxID=3066369 RepID=UPI003306FA63
MWQESRLSRLLNIEYPIVQAPMILQKPLVPLAAAVSNAGGLGSLGCAEMSINELEQRVAQLKASTDKPFNLNFFLHKPPIYRAELDDRARSLVAPFYENLNLELPADTSVTEAETFDAEKLDLLVEQNPAMVSFHFGCPQGAVVDRLKGAGIRVAATATTVSEALALERSGVEIIVAQGWEAGGHRGSFAVNYEDTGIGTMALVPQIVDAVDCLVLAAGGIGDGRAIAASTALGADGVWMGTAFLTCTETPITGIHREALLSASDEDTHLSRAFSGRPCRARRTPYSVGLAEGRPDFPEFPLMYNYSSPIKRHGIAHDDLDHQFLLYGQAAALNRERSAEQLICELVEQTNEILTAMQTLGRTSV